jgi:methylenetetrahydrofolate reductase (NADPH)
MKEKEMKAGTNLEKVLESGAFAVTTEIGPPKGTSAKVVQRKGEALKTLCDAFNITDNQSAVVRMCSLAACSLLKQMGLDPIMQMVCRDRNRLAIQSDILGAVALGIGNILCLSGDHQRLGNHPTAKNVYDLDSIQLIEAVKKMRDEKKFLCGEDISGDAPIYIGAVENPFADPFEFRVIRLAKKVKAGADFIQTQAVYDVDKFAQWMKMVVERGLHRQVHILAGIIPLRAVGMAKYMKENVAGVYIPDEIIKRMEGAKDAREEGIRIAVETIERVKEIEGVRGVHIMAIGWEEAAIPEIVKRAGLLPRPLI